MRIFDKLDDQEIVKNIKNGSIGVIPTDTILGLVCLASDPDSINKLYDFKSREQKPGTVIASSIDQLVKIGFKQRYLKAVEHYWPNPISIVIPCGNELKYIHLGVGSIAVRITSNKNLVKLLDQTGPLLTSSANLPGQPESRNVQEAIKYFGDNVDFYVDQDINSNNRPSTIIRIVDDAVEVLREGQLKIDQSGRITS